MARIPGYKMIIYSMKLKVKIRPTVVWENAEAGLESQEQRLCFQIKSSKFEKLYFLNKWEDSTSISVLIK